MSYYYYAAMDSYDDIIGCCHFFVYLKINCILIEYRAYGNGTTKLNGENTLILANAILKTIPTTYELKFTDTSKQQVKLLKVNTEEIMYCLDMYLEAGFRIHHDDYNNTIEITKNIFFHGEFRRLMERLSALRFPEENIRVRTIKDLY